MKLHPGDEGYPPSLYCVDVPPVLTTTGPLVAARAVAVVGSRRATPGAANLAFDLGYLLARAGVTVVSGGAAGVDRRAHEGALCAGGATWLVSPTGHGIVYPSANADLQQRIVRCERSRLVWPFPDGAPKTPNTPRARNRVLVALAEAVIVIQAARSSGSRNAARWSRRLGRKLFVVPGSPCDYPYLGSCLEIAAGATPVWSVPPLFAALGLAQPDLRDRRLRLCGTEPLNGRASTRPVPRQTTTYPSLFPPDPASWTEDENRVFSAISAAPRHRDEILERAGLPTSSTLTALLTLSLKDVVVEGPDGFFRRRFAP